MIIKSFINGNSCKNEFKDELREKYERTNMPQMWWDRANKRKKRIYNIIRTMLVTLLKKEIFTITEK